MNDSSENQPRRNEEHEERTEGIFVFFVFFVSAWLIFTVSHASLTRTCATPPEYPIKFRAPQIVASDDRQPKKSQHKFTDGKERDGNVLSVFRRGAV